MASGYGMKGHFMVARQNSFGTSNTSSLEAVPIISETLNYSIENLQQQGMYSRFTESPYQQGANLIQGDVNFELQPSTLGFFLNSVVGSDRVASAAPWFAHNYDSLMTEDFDEYSAQHPYTAEVYTGVGSAAVLYDLCGDSLSLSFANNQIAQGTCSFIGAGFTRKAPSSPVYDSDAPLNWSQSCLQIAGANVIDVNDLNITISNNLEPRYVLRQSKWPYRIKRSGFQTVELDGTLTFAAHSYWQQWESGAQSLWQIDINKFNDGSAAHPDRFLMSIPQVRFKTFNVNIAGPGVIEATFTAQGLLDVASNYTTSFVIQNSRAIPY